jgi:myo-inositol 2-dehydrogenase/D-chiro-inositol 1-dehydrogenase
MSSPIRVGFIGAGHIASTHLRILSKDPRARVAGVYDVAADRARATGVPVFDSAEALLDALDAVYITLPNRLHAQYALAALERRKHVFCEKPMTVSREDADRVVQAAARAGTVFQVGHNRRFAPVYQRVKEALSSLEPLCAELKMNRGELENPPWTADDAVTGGYLFETPIHIFDMAAFLMGPIVEVTAHAASLVYSSTTDTFTALFRFASGRTASFVSCAYTGWSFPFERVEVYGRYATLRTEEMDRVSIARGLGQPVESADFRHLPWEERWGYVTEDRLFLDSIEQGRPAAVTAEDGALAVRVALAIYESAQSGKPVRV